MLPSPQADSQPMGLDMANGNEEDEDMSEEENLSAVQLCKKVRFIFSYSQSTDSILIV